MESKWFTVNYFRHGQLFFPFRPTLTKSELLKTHVMYIKERLWTMLNKMPLFSTEQLIPGFASIHGVVMLVLYLDIITQLLPSFHTY